MGRKSIKEDKNYYFRLREEAGFTRAEASEVMNISEARIEKIENDRVTVVPEDIVEMSKGYKKPALCNYYCTHECRIGKDNLNIIEESSIAEISIGILDTLNTLEEKKARLVSIVADGKITDDEKNEFISIGKDLKRINKIIESFLLWMENAEIEGNLDSIIVDAIKNWMRTLSKLKVISPYISHHQWNVLDHLCWCP